MNTCTWMAVLKDGSVLQENSNEFSDVLEASKADKLSVFGLHDIDGDGKSVLVSLETGKFEIRHKNCSTVMSPLSTHGIDLTGYDVHYKLAQLPDKKGNAVGRIRHWNTQASPSIDSIWLLGWRMELLGHEFVKIAYIKRNGEVLMFANN